MAAEGTPYAGVLYAGLMLTPAGPKTLEFNCRLGDPETQVILPLLQSDLVEIILACVEGRLDTLEIDWRSGCAATVVMAAGGYPGAYTKSQPITGLAAAEAAGATVFHAGTRLVNGQTVSDGGRVLAVTALGDDLAGAAQRAYRGVEQIHFEGAQWRSDIARRAPLSDAADRGVDHYRSAGVDIDAGNRAVNLMKAAVRSTFTPAVLADVGSFGGLFALEQLPAQPVLVASTDGVGTKVKLAAQLGRWRGVGHDLVNHCVNDILVQNARPLFFLDYVATAKLQPEVVAEIVGGMAEACRAVGCALLGGETAEMPGVYSEGAYDVAGTIIGLVDRSQIWPRSVAMQAGDRLVGLPSSGPHTNGYSLIRRLIDGCDLAQPLAPGQPPLGDALLRPHRCYLAEVERMQQAGIAIKGMAHITGGGFHDNIPRVLPATLSAQINLQNWTVPPLFAWLQARSGMDRRQALRVFNMGIGMVLIVSPEQTLPLFSLLPEAVTIGVLAPRGSGEAVVFG
jgi:phosphoribosylaminoimidazole synthetase